MMLDDVITRLDVMREDNEIEARVKGASPEWRLDAEALGAACSLLRGYQLANGRTACSARRIMWVTPEQVRLLRSTANEAMIFARYIKSEVNNMTARTKGELDLYEAAARAVSSLTRTEILLREVGGQVYVDDE